MLIDWNEIVMEPAVRRLGEVIRRRWRVWLGVLTPEGRSIPVARTDHELLKPICNCFKANPIRTGEDGELETCARSVRQWAQADPPEEGHTLRCHVGLHALTWALRAPDGEEVGRVYASGFLPGRDEAQGEIALKQALRRAEIPSDRVESSWFDELPRLSRQQEGVLYHLLGALAGATEEAVAQCYDEVAQGGAPPEATSYEGMIGASPPMRRLFRLIDRVANTRSTVLILGENGTGKELVANALHRKSRRRDRPFVVQNCAAIPGELIESELFGHKRGAFSGAHRDRLGLFEVADHGTFFLDEIGEMNLSLQAKMLRVLQEGTFLPVGGSTFRKVDVRLICATNRDLQQMVRDGDFREDLFYRINVITLVVPPLRERSGDIPLLVEHFLARAARVHGTEPRQLAPETLSRLVAHEWPGNVRELENEIERMVILSGDEEVIGPESLSPRISGASPGPEAFAMMDVTLPEAIERLERQMILRGLRETGWNKTQTAKDLGISRRNLIRKVARYEFEE